MWLRAVRAAYITFSLAERQVINKVHARNISRVTWSFLSSPHFQVISRSTSTITDFSRYPVPSLESLPDDLQERIKETSDKTGFVPNVFSALSHRPDELRAFMNYYDIVMEERGSLTKADKEMIVVATSAENNCLYCVVAHGAVHRVYSKHPTLSDQIAVNWRTANLDDRQRAILEFAMDIFHCKSLNDVHFKALENHGLDKEAAWDIGAVVALFALSNRMAFLTSMKPNDEFYLMGRIKREKTAK